MITYTELIKIKGSKDIPADLPDLLKALLIEAAGDWEEAHRIAQEDPSSDGSRVHAYLHRREGDQWNAGYWYRRADEEIPVITLDEEWDLLARSFTS